MGPMLKHATNVTKSGIKGIRWNGEGGGTVQNSEHICGFQGYGSFFSSESCCCSWYSIMAGSSPTDLGSSLVYEPG